MKRVAQGIYVAAMLTLVACANKATPAAVTALSHDTLAAAQDLEANLCFGVADAYSVAPIADKKHCTTMVAAQIGLDDKKHQDIEAGLAQAFQLHRSVNAIAASGGKPDMAALEQAIKAVLDIINTLQQTPAVVQMKALVAAGGK